MITQWPIQPIPGEHKKCVASIYHAENKTHVISVLLHHVRHLTKYEVKDRVWIYVIGLLFRTWVTRLRDTAPNPKNKKKFQQNFIRTVYVTLSQWE